MDKKFNQYISEKIRQIEDSPVPLINLNKDDIWRRIEAGPSIKSSVLFNWRLFAAAALIAGIILIGAINIYQRNRKINNLSAQISKMENEYQVLLNTKKTTDKVFLTRVDTIEVQKRDTVFVTNITYISPPILKHDTIYIRTEHYDTIRILAQTESRDKISVSAIDNMFNNVETVNVDNPYPSPVAKARKKFLTNPNEDFDPNTPKRSAFLARNNNEHQ